MNIHAQKSGNLILVGREQVKLNAQKEETEKKYQVTVHTIAADLSQPDAAMKKPVTDTAFSNFLGCMAMPAEHDGIVFQDSDLEIPFISYNESMWEYFEPELSRRLAELDIDESTNARVRSALTELIPGGACAIEDVAAKIGMSKRTLQRKLSEEQTTFQKQLNNTREMLALHYIRNTDISTNEIAYLLGYQELNSFLRAFAVWTGMSVTEYKKRI